MTHSGSRRESATRSENVDARRAVCPKGGGRKHDGAPLLPLGLFACVVLALELFLSRLLAYALSTHLSYFVLGLGLTGFGASGSLVALMPGWLEPERLSRALASWALAFVALLVVCFAAFVRLTPALPLGIGGLTFVIASLVSLPFVAAGVVVTLALSSAKKKLGSVFAAGLIGSALGCFLPLFALGPCDGSRFIGLLAVLGWLAAWLFTRRVEPSARRAAAADETVEPAAADETVEPRSRRLKLSSVACLALALTALAGAPRIFPIAADPSGQLALIRKISQSRGFRVSRLFDRWSLSGRVEVFEYHDVPGENEPYPFRFQAEDNRLGALMAEWDGRERKAAPPGRIDSSAVGSMCSDTLFGQAYFKPRDRVLVIGVGGGADIQCALYHGARAVDAVEINPATLSALSGPFDGFLGGIGSNPRVRYVVGDGRSFAHAAQRGAYQLIQLSGFDIRSMVAPGALALVENQLYTKEAFVDYLNGLEPGGALSLLRFGEPEALRLVVTGVAALRELGEKQPERHLLVSKNGPIYGVIVTKSALSSEALAMYDEQLWFADRPFRGVSVAFLDPLGLRAHERADLVYRPFDAREPNFKSYFEALVAGQESSFERGYPFAVAPVTDDRPFFFDATRYDLPQARHAPHVVALRSMLGSLLVLAVLLIIGPLLRIRSGLTSLRAFGAPAYFGCVGLAYPLIAIWLLHRFSVFLGRGVYGMSVVLAMLFASTGAGAALGARSGWPPARRAMLGVLGALAWLFAGRWLLPAMLDAGWSTPFGVRILLAGAFVLPLGALIGLAFPAGIDALEQERPRTLAWCVGVGFFASVVGGAAGIPIASESGYGWVLSAGLLGYGGSLVALPLMRKKTAAPA